MLIFKDYFITVAGRFIGTAATFFSLPLLLKYLGVEEYGFVAFASLIAGYANIIDSGLSPTLSVDVAKNSECQRNYRKVINISINLLTNKYFKYSPAMYLLLVLSAYVMLPRVALIRLFYFCGILIIDAYFTVLFRLLYSSLQGLGKHTVANGLHALNIALRAIICVILAIGGSRVEIIYLIQIIVTLFFIFLANKYIYKKIFVSSELSDFEFTSNVLVGKSVTLELTGVAVCIAIINSVPMLVLGRLGEPGELNIYYMASSLGGIFSALQGALISVLVPNMSRNLVDVNNFIDYRIISRNVICASFIFGGLALLLAEPVVQFWARNILINTNMLVLVVKFQLAAVTFASLTLVPYALSIPMRKTKIQFLGTCFYAMLSVISIPVAGIDGGVLFVGGTAAVLSILYSFYYFGSTLKLLYEVDKKITNGGFILKIPFFLAIIFLFSYVIPVIFNFYSLKWLISVVIYVVGVVFVLCVWKKGVLMDK